MLGAEERLLTKPLGKLKARDHLIIRGYFASGELIHILLRGFCMVLQEGFLGEGKGKVSNQCHTSKSKEGGAPATRVYSFVSGRALFCVKKKEAFTPSKGRNQRGVNEKKKTCTFDQEGANYILC